MLFIIHYAFLIEAALGIAEENLFTLFLRKKFGTKSPTAFSAGTPTKKAGSPESIFFDIKLPHILY